MASRKLRKKIRKWVFLITLVALLCYCGWVLVQWINYREAKFTRYPAFGISIPSGYEIHGIDVSRYQHLIAWEEVKAMEVLDVKLGFAFIKATEGIGNRDPQFVRNWRQTRHHSMVRGAYHFFIAAGLLWLMAAFTGGLYLKLAYIGERPLWAVLIFYVFIITLLVLLIRYYLRMWR